MATFISHSPEETERLGEAWGRRARRGWVFALTGDLGAGKTQLVRGLARGLGISSRVHSPTFALLNEYSGGREPLFHLDLYRLETPQQIVDAGLEPYLIHPAGVSVVEWGERWFGSEGSGASRLPVHRVRLEVMDETSRRITYEDSGP
jgi:tRNA threonylcarbamoyladenosine biosynthesis protein TsaE